MSYQHLIAGILGGVSSTVALHPLDLLKVRFAVSDGRSQLKKTYKNIPDAFATIVREEGFKGLYKGVTPNCIGAGTAWGLYFLFYDAVKNRMFESNQQHLGPSKHMTAGACAGVLTIAITNPIWVVKTRLCLQYSDLLAPKKDVLLDSKRYKGTWDALRKIYKFEGIAGLYRGFVPGLFGVSHGAIQLTAYEELKRVYLTKYNLPKDHSLETSQYLTCAALSKLLAASITYPYQVVRARLQDQHVNYEGVLDVVRQTWKYESFGGFYKGFTPSLLRVVPACAITFVVYERSLALCREASINLSGDSSIFDTVRHTILNEKPKLE